MFNYQAFSINPSRSTSSLACIAARLDWAAAGLRGAIPRPKLEYAHGASAEHPLRAAENRLLTRTISCPKYFEDVHCFPSATFGLSGLLS